MTAAQDSRAQFEAVASDGGKWPKAIERDSNGNYLLMQTASGWEWWKVSRAALSAEPVAYLRFWAWQHAGSPDTGPDQDEGYVVCLPSDKGVDGSPAFPVYAAPQPAAQERKPLSDERIFELNLEAWDKMRDHTAALLRFARFVEREHGITGEPK